MSRRTVHAALSDIGRVRTHNEDSVLAQPPLYVVADGLGGHEAGEVASSIAVETLRDNAPRHADAKALARAVRAANREVLRAAKEGFGKPGMGTTITAALVEGQRIALSHVGDSRAYLLYGDGVLEQLTDDHSMVADMVRAGDITEAEARVHPHRSVITRALGTDPQMVADAFEVVAEPGDRLLLCSDGLSGMLDDSRIAELLGAYRDPSIAAHALVDAANDAGGSDNISVVIVDIEGEGGDAERSARRRSLWAAWGWVLVAVAIVAAVLGGTYAYARTRWFVIAEDGYAVIYRGVPGDIANIALRWEVARSPLDESALDPSQRDSLADAIVVDDLAAARALIETLDEPLRGWTPDPIATGTVPATGTP